MSAPNESSSFAERLDWLLATVPRVPGTAPRFSIDEVVAVLSWAVPLGRRATRASAHAARAWLEAVRAGHSGIPDDRASGRYVAALEDLFRLPLGYFWDVRLAAAADARIVFAREATANGIRLIGPCRVMASEMSARQLHDLHLEVAAALERRRPAS
jgi:hypothetical protein